MAWPITGLLIRGDYACCHNGVFIHGAKAIAPEVDWSVYVDDRIAWTQNRLVSHQLELGCAFAQQFDEDLRLK